MDPNIEGEAQRIKERINYLQRRLQKLQKRQDLCGWNTPPEVSIEIEDIEAEIENLQGSLKKLEDGVKLSPGEASSEVSGPREKYRLSVVNDLKEAEGTEEGKASIGRDVHFWSRGTNWILAMAVIVILVFLTVIVFWLNSRETSCPHKVLVLIRPFEGNGDLNVERSIHEAFGEIVNELAQTGTGQIDVQIENEGSTIPDDVDHVFVVEGWYDRDAVHAKICQGDDGQFLSPGEANVVSAAVAIKVCHCVHRIWEKEGCYEAAYELLAQLMLQSASDQEWEKLFLKLSHES